jgi:hypothetical protein
MTKQSFLIALTLFVFSLASKATESNAYLGIEFGKSTFEIDSSKAVVDGYLDGDSIASSVIAGYRWSNNIVVEASYIYSANNLFGGITDFSKAYEAKAMAGYTIDINRYLKLTPLIGLSSWELNVKEGILLNPGPEQSAKYSGTDITYKLALDYIVTDSFIVSLSYGQTNLDIGSSSSAQFGAKYEF